MSVIETHGAKMLDALALNGTDRMELRVFASETHPQAVLVARLDNLGKGASGAAMQNLDLMIGAGRARTLGEERVAGAVAP